jgi:hypothetical protein
LKVKMKRAWKTEDGRREGKGGETHWKWRRNALSCMLQLATRHSRGTGVHECAVVVLLCLLLVVPVTALERPRLLEAQEKRDRSKKLPLAIAPKDASSAHPPPSNLGMYVRV